MTPLASDPFARALALVGDQLRRAELQPGEPVQPAVIAEALRISPTPVREALAHLAGAGLLVRHNRQGYVVPSLSATELIDLFWHESLLLSVDPVDAHPLAQAELVRLRTRLAPVLSLMQALELQGGPAPEPPVPADILAARRRRLVEAAEQMARALRDRQSAAGI